MKRLLAAALTIVAAVCAAFCCAATTLYARADEVAVTAQTAIYARANSRESYLCSSADLATGLFAVPYTYCVEVLGEEGEWYSVKYAEDYGIYRAVYGYVLKSDFTILDEAPEVTFLYRQIDVTFSQQSSGGSLPTIDDITVAAAFYGNYYSGAAGYSYVLCQGSFGYISGAIEDYDLIETTSADTDAEQTEGSGGNVVAYIALGVISVLSLGLVAAACVRGAGKRHR